MERLVKAARKSKRKGIIRKKKGQRRNCQKEKKTI